MTEEQQHLNTLSDQALLDSLKKLRHSQRKLGTYLIDPTFEQQMKSSLECHERSILPDKLAQRQQQEQAEKNKSSGKAL
jgi:hypothetical protein